MDDLQRGLMRAYQLKLSGRQLTELFKHFDIDNSNTISLSEFMAGVMGREFDPDNNVLKVFNDRRAMEDASHGAEFRDHEGGKSDQAAWADDPLHVENLVRHQILHSRPSAEQLPLQLPQVHPPAHYLQILLCSDTHPIHLA